MCVCVCVCVFSQEDGADPSEQLLPTDPSYGGMMLGPGRVMGAAYHMGHAMGIQAHYTMAYPGEGMGAVTGHNHDTMHTERACAHAH